MSEKHIWHPPSRLRVLHQIIRRIQIAMLRCIFAQAVSNFISRVFGILYAATPPLRSSKHSTTSTTSDGQAFLHARAMPSIRFHLSKPPRGYDELAPKSTSYLSIKLQGSTLASNNLLHLSLGRCYYPLAFQSLRGTVRRRRIAIC
jgi:hypothetical protein